MIQIRPANARGHGQYDWLDTYHTFSFSTYYDPRYRGFRDLRVINDDRIQPNRGFGTHSHTNMEIITYVLEGALEHKDSMGNGSVIYPGEVQYMSAGSGVQHSEFNPSQDKAVHLLQIWILPNEEKTKPRYDQRTFPAATKQNRWCLIVSPDGTENSIAIRQDIKIYASILAQHSTLNYNLTPSRAAWLHVARGELALNQQHLSTGDGAAITDEITLNITGLATDTEFLLFDLN